MWPGRRAQASAEHLPALSAEICLPDQACLEAPSEDDDAEQYTAETARRIDDMVVMASAWGMAAAEMPGAISARREQAEDHEGWEKMGDDRSVRRQVDRRKDNYALGVIAWAHNTGRTLARPNLPANAPKLVAIQDPVDLDRRIADIGDTLVDDAEGYDILARQFRLLFIAEETVHAQMAMLDLTDPRAFRDLFDPAAITELPLSLRQLAALDINRDKDSIILRNARRVIEDSRTPGQQMADYLTNNHLPDNIRQVVMGVSLGARALGAPVCPLNDAGLCTKVLERLSMEELPEPLRRDMEIRASKLGQDRLARLMQFARTAAPARILDSSVAYDLSAAAAAFEPTPTGDGAPVRKRRQGNGGNGTKADKRDIVFDNTPELQEPSFNTVSVRILKDDGEPVVLRVGDKVSLRPLLETKPFKKYLSSHRGAKLDDMIENALHQILFSRSYDHSGGMIVSLVDRKLKASQNQSGVTERLMRFSGQHLPGMNSGKIGRQTRIIFSQGTEKGVRYVTIRKVVHKSDIEKGIRL